MLYRALIKKSDDWWIGWLVDLPGVNAQEKSREELLRSLAIGARDMLESEVDFEPDAQMIVVEVPDPEWTTHKGDSWVAESESGGTDRGKSPPRRRGEERRTRSAPMGNPRKSV